MITQNEIARLAGVSRATVQRVITGEGYVNSQTRQKVLQICRDMDYRPNRAAQALVGQQKQIRIGCLMVQSDNPFYHELNQGLMNEAKTLQSYGVEVILQKALFTGPDQLRKIEELLQEKISALVIQPSVGEEVGCRLRALEQAGIPVVTVNTDLPGYQPKLCYVGNDFFHCGRTAANLLALITGHATSVGVVTGFSNAKSHSDRIDGFRDYIRDYPSMRFSQIVENHDDDRESYEAVCRMLEEDPSIDSVFLAAGGVLGACRAIIKQKQESGRHFHVISFDDVPSTRQLVRDKVIQATVCQQPIRQGELALEILSDYLVQGKKPEKNRIYTDIQIKIKENIDCSEG